MLHGRRAGGRSRSARRFLSGPLVGLLWLSSCSESPSQAPCGAACAPPGATLEDTFDVGALEHRVVPREGWGGLKVRLSGGRALVLETTRDGQSLGHRRLVAYTSTSSVLWSLEEAPGEFFSDFTLHPSGDLTLGVERTQAERGGYELLRLSSDGQVLARAPLPDTATLPPGDVGTDLPARPFRMKSREVHALRDGWLRTEAREEDVVSAFLSLVDEPSTRPGGSPFLVTGVMSLRWTEGRYVEQWTRLVDGRHRVEPGVWAYDEFRWREAPSRPLLALDGWDGRVVVGRTWNSQRCLASNALFQQPSRTECLTGENVTSPMDTEYQPFAYTAFSPEGEREETHAFVPASVAEFVVFDFAAKGGEVAVAGTVVRRDAEGVIDYYPPSPGSDGRMAPYDGYVAVLGRGSGVPRFERTVGGERADHLSALRWTRDGLLVVGATGWDRWHGGMSISRGAGPLLALVSSEGGEARMRTLPLDGGARHFHLLGVDAREGAVLAVGLADAPLTHSGDGGQTASMTFGGLVVDLR